MDESFQTDNQRHNVAQTEEKPASAFFAGPEIVSDPSCYADSGATNHVTAEFRDFMSAQTTKANGANG